jgi:human immunodeficiency virus type I enhancer-binding protein
MKSKAHFKKCSELGLNPIPTMPDDDVNDMDEKSRGLMNGCDDMRRDDSETEDNESDDDGDDESGDEGKIFLHNLLN